jgi:hypothetical protein
LNGKRIHIGVYDTAHEAFVAYCEHAGKEYAEFFNIGV